MAEIENRNQQISQSEQDVATMTAALRRAFVFVTMQGAELPIRTLEGVNTLYRFSLRGNLGFFILTVVSRLRDEPLQDSWFIDAKDLIRKYLRELDGDFEIIREENMLYCLTGFVQTPAEQERVLNKIFSELRKVKGAYTCVWTLGIGEYVQDVEQFSRSVFTAQCAMKFCITEGIGRIYNANRRDVNEHDIIIMTLAEQVGLKTLVEQQNPDQLQEKILTLFEKKSTKISQYPPYAYMLGEKIQTTIFQTLQERMPIERSIYNHENERVAKINTLISLEGIQKYTVQCALELCTLYGEYLKNRRTQPVWLAINYIQENYTNNITLEELAVIADRNPQYISSIFSQKCGMSIKEYITALRIDEAKRLLRTTLLPVSKIAEQIGYQDAKYFSRIFRRQTSLSPRAYRISASGVENKQKKQNNSPTSSAEAHR